MKDIGLLLSSVIALVTAAQLTAGAAGNPLPGATTVNVHDNDGPCHAIRVFAHDRLLTPLSPAEGGGLINLENLGFPCLLPGSQFLNFVIASVPDPIGTHLQLWFDRSVESISSAAGFVGFRFQRSWIPWDSALVQEEPDIDKRKARQEQLRTSEAEPGVLTFRAPPECASPVDPKETRCRDLVVLLVPETPTGGFAEDVFHAAIQIVQSTSIAASQPNFKIPVLGPSFSSSFSSLAKIMSRDNLTGKLRVVSGTASSTGAELLPKNTYQRTVHSVDDEFQMLVDQVTRKGEDPPKIALLTESDTGLGWHLSDPNMPGSRTNQERFIYRYPREISRLRNAYGDQELKAVVGAQQQAPSFQRILGFRLFDVATSADSTPIMATTQTPLSQDAVLEDIARSMERDQIKLAGVAATDIFDALFIVRYLRDACPNIRLFTFDSDLLYEKGAQDFPFDGILGLSTYPLMLSDQTWTGLERTGQNGDTSKYRILFPSRGAEGTYNATRTLLVESHYVSEDMATEPLAEYFNPSIACSKGAKGCRIPPIPPIWLTVLTRSGYWPVALESKDLPSQDPKDMFASSSARDKPDFGLDSPPYLWKLFFLLTVLSFSVYFFSHFVACASDSWERQRVKHSNPRPDEEGWLENLRRSLAGIGELQGIAQLSLWPNEEGWLARLCYLLVCSLSLLAFYGVYILPLFAISLYRDKSGLHPWLYWAGLFFVVFVALACSPFMKFLGGRKKVGMTRIIWPQTWHLGILALCGMCFAFVVIEVAQLFPLHPQSNDQTNDQRAFFMAYRALHFESGVSPLLPLLALLAACFGWGRVHLKRITMRFERIASVPVLGSGPRFEALAKCKVHMERFVNEPLPLHGRTVGSFVPAALILTFLGSALKSFELAAFDRLVLVLLTILYSLLFLTWARFILIWTKFRLFLEYLDQHPIRLSFKDLPTPTPISPLLHIARRRSYRALVDVRDRLRALPANESEEWTAAVATFDQQVDKLFESVTEGAVVRRINALPLLQSLKWINALIVDELNQGGWREGHVEGKAAAMDADTAEGPARPETLYREIIAIQYSDYIQYIARQQQNLLVFVTTGFLLSLVALHCYPFQSPRMINTFISLGFFMFGAGVVAVLAQADRDPVLSRITKTTPDKLSGGFFLRVAGYLGLPFISVLASQFPSWGRFLFSWVQPIFDAVK